MNPVEKAEEIAKVRSYIEQIESEIEKVGTLEKLMDILSKMSLDTILEQRIKKTRLSRGHSMRPASMSIVECRATRRSIWKYSMRSKR
jgi:hypothetical protein